MTKKHVVDGKVAVLISPGFGAGWSTWAPPGLEEEFLFDPGLVELLLNKATSIQLRSYAEKRWPGAYHGGAGSLEVHWVPEGERFDVDEYDGSEALVVGERKHRA